MKPKTFIITKDGLTRLVDALRATGARVVAPTTARGSTGEAAVDYRRVDDGDQIALDGPLPRRSLKEFFLPPTETLLRWRQQKGQVSIEGPPPEHEKTVVLGAVPCDAAALPVLDKVMGWDYRDEPWFGRREATTVISRACPGRDESCFCTALGLSPDSRVGADLLLVPISGGDDHLVEVVTERGEELVSAHQDSFETPQAGAGDGGEARAAAEKRVADNLQVSPEDVKAWLEANFDHPLWSEIAQRCHGCGACAAVCPTCHCFDIVDEPEGIDSGARRRNWDTCQTALFTLHGSGHNPRETQTARCRQRLTHKFAIYPKRFEAILCTGCGRCARACAAGMHLPSVLRTIDELASRTKAEQAASGGTG